MAGALSEEVVKRIKALRKKLVQIEKLKARGGQFTEEESTKVNSEAKLLAEIEALESGKEVPAFAEAGGGGAQKEPEAPPKAEPEDAGEADKGGAEEPPKVDLDLPPAEAEKRIRTLKKKLAQIAKLKEKGGGYSKEETEKVSSEPSLLMECTELEINLLDPEPKKAARILQKKLDQISKLRAKGQLSLQEKEKVNKEASIKKELTDILGARVPLKEPTTHKEDAPDAKAAPKKETSESKAAAKAAARPAQTPAPATKPQQAAPAKPAQQSARAPQPERAAYTEPPVSLAAGEGTPEEDDSHVAEALAQAFAQEEMMEEEGFLESRASTRKRAIQAKAQAKAEAARLEQEQLAAQRAQQEQEAKEAAAAAERARQEQEAAQRARQEQERALAAQRAQQEEQDRLQRQREADKAAAEAAAAEADADAAAGGPPAAAAAAPAAAPAPAPAAAAPPAAAPARKAAVETPAPEAQVSDKPAPEKRLRALKKKLGQIEKLKQRGGEYTAEEQEKLTSEAEMLQEIAALERGEPWPPQHAVEQVPVKVPVEEPVAVEEPQVEEPPAPVQAAPKVDVESLAPAEAEKRLKALRKKLAQIAKLKERGGQYSEEEAIKLASEKQILEDITKLEAHLA